MAQKTGLALFVKRKNKKYKRVLKKKMLKERMSNYALVDFL